MKRKFSDDEIRALREHAASGVSDADLAERYGTSAGYARRLRLGLVRRRDALPGPKTNRKKLAKELREKVRKRLADGIEPFKVAIELQVPVERIYGEVERQRRRALTVEVAELRERVKNLEEAMTLVLRAARPPTPRLNACPLDEYPAPTQTQSPPSPVT